MRKIFLFIVFISMYFLGQSQYAPTSSKTRFVNGIGLSTKDTASLSNAGDTLAMIVGKDSLVYFKYKGYWKPIAYNSSLDYYVKYSDTATMLSSYYNKTAINSLLSNKLNISDTASMLSGYKTYYPRNAISGGTGISYNPSTGVITNTSSGTVTSVATNNASGITGGTITTSGTIAADTSILATRLRVQKGIDSVNANVNLRVKYSDTATMLSSYYNKTATDSKLALKLNISDTATMLSPYARTLALGGYIPYTGATSAIDLNAKTVVNISHLGINTTTIPTIALRAIGDNNSTSRIAMRGYSSDANSSSIRVTKFRGTVAAPQAPQSGDNLGKFELAGYGTTSSEGYPQATFEALATENWGATARGAKIQFKVTPNTTTTQALALTINQDKSAVFENSVTGTSIIKTGGTSSQFLKADGSVDANAYLNISDTATMLSGYKTYYPRAALSAGTGITYNASTGVITNNSPSTGGTVTSVATNTGSGITGGTITTSGTIAADTSVLATRLRVQKGIDSLGAAKISGSGSGNYVAKFTGVGVTLGNSTMQDDGSKVSIPGQLEVGGYVRAGTSVQSEAYQNLTGYTGLILSSGVGIPRVLIGVPTDDNTNELQVQGGTRITGQLKLGSTITNGTYTYTLPSATGTIALVGGSGVGTVTSVATDATMTGGTITTSGTLKVDTSVMATRLRVQKGIDSLGAAKQSNITLTTTGTSGAATFTSNTLNIPQYQAAGTYVTSVTGTSPIVSSGGTTPAISIPVATTSVSGYLSSTDWNTFNNKQSALTNPVTGTGTTNYLPKFTGASTIGNSSLVDNGSSIVYTNSSNPVIKVTDGTYSSYFGTVGTAGAYNSGSQIGDLILRAYNGVDIGVAQGTTALHITSGGNVGIGTTSPITKLHVDKASQTIGGTTPNGGLVVTGLAGGNYALELGTDAALEPWIQSRNATSATYYSLALNPSGGNVLIGTTTDAGYKLDVNGTGRFSSNLFVNNGSNTISAAYGSIDINGSSGGGTIYSSGGVFKGRVYANSSLMSIETNGALPINFYPNGSLALTIASTGAATFSSTLGINGVADNIKSGTYTPTITDITPMTGTSISVNTYTRIGNIVTFSGVISGTVAVGINQYSYEISLPITQTNTNNRVYGSGWGSIVGGIGHGAVQIAQINVNKAYLYLQSDYGGNFDFGYTISYEVQ